MQMSTINQRHPMMIESSKAAADLTQEEWEEILAITHAAFAEHKENGLNMVPCDTTLENHKAFLYRCQLFIIRENGRIIAYKAGRIDKAGNQNFFQVQIACVLPENKGKGLGKKVHQLLEEYARTSGCAYLVTNTSCKATRSYAFHQSMGFKNWYYCHFEGKNYISIVLRKDLQNGLPGRWKPLIRSWLSTHLKFHHDGSMTHLYRLYKKLHDRSRNTTKQQSEDSQHSSIK
jgi:GNAT superfamily N-acetyltransferase